MKRIFVFAALLAALFSAPALLSAQAQQNRAVITAQGNPYLLDFTVLQNKRSDLRLNVARLGLNAAFSEWLSVEHSDAYRSALRQSASRTSSGVKTAASSKRTSGSCCVMASGCCSMCPACCEQRSCPKSCCNLSACIMRPRCCKSA